MKSTKEILDILINIKADLCEHVKNNGFFKITLMGYEQVCTPEKYMYNFTPNIKDGNIYKAMDIPVRDDGELFYDEAREHTEESNHIHFINCNFKMFMFPLNVILDIETFDGGYFITTEEKFYSMRIEKIYIDNNDDKIKRLENEVKMLKALI